jgi:hypothetical protein
MWYVRQTQRILNETGTLSQEVIENRALHGFR